MNKIELSNNKTLKLTNVILCETDLSKKSFENTIIQMDNYIKSKKCMPIGPLIQKSSFFINEDGKIEIRAYILRQSNSFIDKIEAPYKMEKIIRVSNCMYARYVGPEEKMKLAFDKINVIAFEEDIELKKESYTIFVNKLYDNIVADIFVEKITNA